MPFLCQIYGCGDGTCNTETGKCACDGEGVHNYDCTEKGDGDGGEWNCGIIAIFIFEKNIYFHMRKDQQKTQQLKLCTKGRVKKKQ